MSAFTYLVTKQWRNSLREKIRHPQFWIGVLIVLAYFALYIYQEVSHTGATGVLDNAIPTFKGGVTIVFLIIAFASLCVGLNHGSSFFMASDINYLFVSPLSPYKILLYGLLRKFLLSAIATLILLMQLTNLRFYFGLGIRELLILMASWILLSMSLSAITLSVYSITSVSKVMRRIILIALYLTSATVLLGVVFALWQSGTPFSDTITFFNEPHLHYIPLGGWASGFMAAGMDGNWDHALIFAGLLVLLPMIGLFFAFRNRSAYYEDVLTSIGHGYGNSLYHNTSEMMIKDQGKKRKSHLLGKKRGEVVLFQRQMTEQRRSLTILFDRGTLGMMALAVLLGAFLQSLQRKGMYPFIMEILSVAILCYAMIFTIPMGKFVDELNKPFIYLIPGSSLRKLYYASTAPVIKAFVEGILCFVIVSLFARLHPAFVLCGAFFYASAALLFYASYLASLKTMGLRNSRGAHMTLAFAILSAIFLFELSFGANIGRKLYDISPNMFLLDFVILAAFNVVVSVAFFYSSKGILDYRA
ncbi:MAG: putative ABC exporter domain-containing protein [Clostridiales bacterium]|nr:putative ABC exporter domain-containing protein [Clostridiales bacterium]